MKSCPGCLVLLAFLKMVKNAMVRGCLFFSFFMLGGVWIESELSGTCFSVFICLTRSQMESDLFCKWNNNRSEVLLTCLKIVKNAMVPGWMSVLFRFFMFDEVSTENELFCE